MRVNGLSIVDFFKQVKVEFKRIFWPSRNEVFISVVVVIIMLSISSMFLLAIDQLIGWFMHFLLNIGD
ncbi:preprotein translocase subunit SecE [Candidatus Liberibacter solanacearum]|uniref:Protein translocase subunit SecE n=1 Tax=Candidatus Liberibacter solanacearum TaxID=556287 RepID=A0A3R7R8Z8_9HYPH|nr:preprotein translocase subunit SecE [Candidatus Liberibacter solanacearum]RPD36884.1 preprotein translocase subunit SecE [Candidatus Liberibacter solanacearum]